MRIAAYVEHAYRSRGGNCVYETELVRHLGRVDERNEYTLFTSATYRDAPDLDVSGNPRFARRALPLSHGMCQASWLVTNRPAVDSFVGAHDVFHSMNPIVFPARRGRYVVTVHDLFTLTVPRLVSWRHRFVWKVHVKRMLRRADRFVAVSESTLRDMVEHLNIAPDRITVVPEGVRQPFGVVGDDVVADVRRKYGLEHRYLMVGESRSPRKNVPRMIRAFARARADAADAVDLVVTSPGAAFSQGVIDEVARAGITDAVKFLARVSDEDLVGLMNGATALLFASLYEGFGLPILEAMACDTPVVTSSVSAMPEVAGDAGILVDPTDEEAIAEAIRRLLTDEEMRLQHVEAGRRRVRQFTWERTAKRYVEIYESLA